MKADVVGPSKAWDLKQLHWLYWPRTGTVTIHTPPLGKPGYDSQGYGPLRNTALKSVGQKMLLCFSIPNSFSILFWSPEMFTSNKTLRNKRKMK